MRARIIAGVSALALLAGPAFAQTTAPSNGTLTSPGTTAPRAPGLAGAPAAAPAPRPPAPDPLTQEDVSKIKGTSVYGSDDKKIGDVGTVLIKPDTKSVDRLVVIAGGVLGFGGHSVALPLSDFKWDGQMDAFKISKTADELKAMPEWRSASSDINAAPTTAVPSSLSPPVSHTAPPSASGTSGTSTPTQAPTQ